MRKIVFVSLVIVFIGGMFYFSNKNSFVWFNMTRPPVFEQQVERKMITFVGNLETLGGTENMFFSYSKLLTQKYHVNFVSGIEIPNNILSFCKANKVNCVTSSFVNPHPTALQLLNRSAVVIDFHMGEGFALMWKITNPKVKKILWLHGSSYFVQQYLGFIDWLVYNKVVCLTDIAKDKLSSLHPEIDDKFVRIYNGLDFDEIKRKAEEYVDDIEDDGYFVHVSRLDSDKDLKTLIEAYDLFYQKTKSKTALYIVGDGKYRYLWERFASSHSSAHQIKFFGKKDNPFVYMKKAKAVVLSSPSEGFSLVLVEALVCSDGVVVASDCPDGPREVLDDGKYGLLFDVGAVQKLADYMEQIDKNKINRQMFLDGLDEHLQKFTLPLIEKDILKLIEE